MSDIPNPDPESRLRAALAARADAVEPRAAGAETSTVARMEAARRGAARRRLLLAAAAVVLVVAAVAGALVLAGDDDPDRTDVATAGETTTTSPATVPPTDEPVIWPLPTMSVSYPTAGEAAMAFATAYAGLPSTSCVEDREADVPEHVVLVLPPDLCQEPSHGGPATQVRAQRRAQGWVVAAAASTTFEVATPPPGAVVGADIEVLVEGLDPAAVATATVPPLGADPATSPSVDTSTIPLGEDGSWRLVLGAADGPTVLLVTDGATATARVFTVDSAAVPPETTTTTTGPTDDGTQGWPGATSRQFETPESAAHAFVTDLLGFADPALADLTEEGPDAIAVYHPRPTAAISTSITLHHTGTARGWVVTGVASDQGVVDSVTRDGPDVTVAGRALAFEAHVDVRLLDLAGNVLGSTFTTTTDGTQLAPFQVVVHQDVDAAGPVFVQIAEGDASGEGTFSWATWAAVPE